MKVVLANIDYRRHLTDEGDQLQRGLEFAGWRLVGKGYDNLQDVRRILDRYKPEAVFVSDKRDFDPKSPGAFRKDVGFLHLGALAKAKDVFKVAVVKDAGSVPGYHHEFVEEIGADAIAVYYDENRVRGLNPWIGGRKLLRTYHSVDVGVCLSTQHWTLEEERRPRRRGVVSGALDRMVYPLRCRVVDAQGQLKIDHLHHPGYHNKGSGTPEFLKALSMYRVHVATASIYGFALRKIVESVAQGATPVTNLPAEDVLPEIDQALVRIPSDIAIEDLSRVIDEAELNWIYADRWEYAEAARNFYDFRAIGTRLDRLIEGARCSSLPV